MLKDIMSTQQNLQERLGYEVDKMNPTQLAAYMRDQRGYLADEIAEALYEMPEYKAWKNYTTMTSDERVAAWKKVKMELVDALHFFVNMLLAAGFTAEELHSMYMAKNKENHRRQDAGYTADVSYRDQCVEEVLQVPAEGVEPCCTVVMDDTIESTEDFVAIMVREDERMSLRYNTDVLTMGMAAKIVLNRYAEMLDELDEPVRKEVQKTVGILTMEETDNA